MKEIEKDFDKSELPIQIMHSIGSIPIGISEEKLKQKREKEQKNRKKEFNEKNKRIKRKKIK